MEENQSTSLFGLGIDNISKGHLSEAARWAKFLAICGFIMIGLMLIYAVFMSVVFADISSFDSGASYRTDEMRGFLGVFFVIFYGVCALLAFFPYLFLLRFANKMKRALQSEDQTELNGSFMSLKILYRYLGILTIIGLAFIFLGLISVAFSAAALR